jgi:Inner membrane component domain
VWSSGDASAGTPAVSPPSRWRASGGHGGRRADAHHDHRHPVRRAGVQAPTGRRPTLSVFGNVIWCILAGWWLALGHVITGVALWLTIIGIPLGASFKMAGAALVPFGKEIVALPAGTHAPAGMIVVSTRLRDERA